MSKPRGGGGWGGEEACDCVCAGFPTRVPDLPQQFNPRRKYDKEVVVRKDNQVTIFAEQRVVRCFTSKGIKVYWTYIAGGRTSSS